uniref:NTF2 domain-containing protein n=1 Tax=Amblyomma cajennense TaxID=34607 RepID=A0A023FEL3_AMBCJ
MNFAPISFDLGVEETMPLSKPSYFPSEEVKQVVVQFLEQYFSIFDSKDRSGLLDAYHDNAVFSLTAMKLATTKTDIKEFQRESRNLARLTNIDARRDRLKSGRLNIVSFLNQLPETRHDPSSFTVDVPLVTPTLMCFSVFGILRLVHKGLILPPLRSFTRNFFVVPKALGFLSSMKLSSLREERKTRSGHTPRQKTHHQHHLQQRQLQQPSGTG